MKRVYLRKQDRKAGKKEGADGRKKANGTKWRLKFKGNMMQEFEC